MEQTETQRCSQCKATKRLEEFGANRARENGRNATCKACRKKHPKSTASRNKQSKGWAEAQMKILHLDGSDY